MRSFLLVTALVLAALTTGAAVEDQGAYSLVPGTTKLFTFTQSKIFPGTVREVTVFIPAQYDGSSPACVYVKTDGFNPREKTLLETMIATREMPVTIGVFVADWDDDAGPESICYSIEGRQFIATRTGVQITADDGPTQVILPVPDRSRVIGVALGGPDKDTLFAFCGDRIWQRKIRQHAMGAFSPWAKVSGTNL